MHGASSGRFFGLCPSMHEVLEIRTEEEMRAFVEASRAAVAVLFKYSPTCGISLAVEDAWEAWLESVPEGVALARCDVLGAKPAARGITTRLGIPHQSPQVLVLREGKVLAHTSHYSITADWLRKAVG